MIRKGIVVLIIMGVMSGNESRIEKFFFEKVCRVD